MTTGERYMQVALRLARRGPASVDPNPAVGAVIVKNGRIIGRGWHRKFGGPHAEINALENCRKQGGNPKGATMFVTLEPCCHVGKTGPCTDALIAAKLKRVVVATIDPSKHANGRGIRQLRRAGIKVDVGECEGQARILNAPFLKFAATGKTWVTVKWAQSIDGKLAWANSGAGHRWITCEESRKDAHKLRRRVGAVLVGINTVLKDDPLLTPRPSRGRKPIRIILDSRLRIPLNCQLLASAKDVPVLIVASNTILRAKSKKAEQIKQTGAELLGFPDRTKSNLKFLLRQLAKRGLQHLLVEGGPTVIGSFLKENLADEVVVYIAPKILGAQGCADIVKAVRDAPECDILHWCNVKMIRDDVRVSGLTIKGFRTIVLLSREGQTS